MENDQNKNLKAEKKPPSIKDDDFDLIRRFNEGEQVCFKYLMLKHKEKVRNLVYVTVNNFDLVDDISQEVFINVFDKLKEFRYESQFTTWLYRITVNKCRDYLRKVKIRSIFVPISDYEESRGGPKYSSEYVDTKEILQNAIARLPEKLKKPLVMREIEELSYKEIADILGSEVGTIKSRIFRARELLKILLQPLEKEL